MESSHRRLEEIEDFENMLSQLKNQVDEMSAIMLKQVDLSHSQEYLKREINEKNSISTLSKLFIMVVITEISSAHGDKNFALSNSIEVIHGTELISQHSKEVKNYTK